MILASLWLGYALVSAAAVLGVALADARGWLPPTRQRAWRAVFYAGVWPGFALVLLGLAFVRSYEGLVRFLAPVPGPRRNRRRRPHLTRGPFR